MGPQSCTTLGHPASRRALPAEPETPYTGRQLKLVLTFFRGSYVEALFRPRTVRTSSEGRAVRCSLLSRRVRGRVLRCGAAHGVRGRRGSAPPQPRVVRGRARHGSGGAGRAASRSKGRANRAGARARGGYPGSTSPKGPVTRTLAGLRPGERGRIASLGGDPEATRRLMDLGLIRGTPVEVIRVAPLGDPIELRVRGFMLTLRRSEAEHIVLE